MDKVDLKEKIYTLSDRFEQSATYKIHSNNPYIWLGNILGTHVRNKDVPVLNAVLDRLGGVRSVEEVNAGALEGIAIQTLSSLVTSGVVRKVIDEEATSETKANAIVETVTQQALGELSRRQTDHGIVR